FEEIAPGGFAPLVASLHRQQYRNRVAGLGELGECSAAAQRFVIGVGDDGENVHCATAAARRSLPNALYQSIVSDNVRSHSLNRSVGRAPLSGVTSATRRVPSISPRRIGTCTRPASFSVISLTSRATSFT